MVNPIFLLENLHLISEYVLKMKKSDARNLPWAVLSNNKAKISSIRTERPQAIICKKKQNRNISEFSSFDRSKTTRLTSGGLSGPVSWIEMEKQNALCEARTHDLQIIRLTR